MPKETGWAITGKYGLYIGWWQRRRDAIEAHVRDKVICGASKDPVNDIWKMCQKNGDRAVKVTVTYRS